MNRLQVKPALGTIIKPAELLVLKQYNVFDFVYALLTSFFVVLQYSSNHNLRAVNTSAP